MTAVETGNDTAKLTSVCGAADVPYNDNSELPKSVRDHLPEHAQTIYREAFNMPGCAMLTTRLMRESRTVSPRAP